MSKRFKLSAVLGAIAALGIAASQPAHAAIVNGGFEAFPDFAGWTTIGDATIQDSTFKAPPEGSVQAALTNNTAVTATQLEAFLNLTAGTLTGTGATTGSAIKQTVNVTAGQLITFKFDFGTNEATPDLNHNDFGFVSVTSNNLGTLANTQSSFSPTNGLENFSTVVNKETGYQSYTVQFNASGSYTLGFGVVNVGDTLVTSALLVDDVAQVSGPPAGVANLIINNPGGPIGGGGGSAVPLPAAVFLFPLGAAVAGAAGKRLRRKADAE